ncbi:MAG TPA: CheR family methyltransferase [Leptolyngbyaceae cyanobacterium]
MNEALLERFVELISARTGLQIREQDKGSLANKIWMRLKLLRLSRAEDYYQVLAGNIAEGHSWEQKREKEWRELTHLLTTGESYFFRDKGQINLLSNRILPEIIEAKNQQAKTQNNQKRSLRIWSAGCSTGEEPYSLAIVLREILPDWEDWDILILGTDINQKSIEKAKEGIYSSWSFRLVENQLQMRYFYPRQTEWQIDDQIRKMVTFSYGNLVKDDYPNDRSIVSNMDLIICRNVFVYFDYKAIALVLKKFYNTLVPGGYLLTGHTELYNQELSCFQVMVFPESVIYKRNSEIKQLKTATTPTNYSEDLPFAQQKSGLNSKQIESKESDLLNIYIPPNSRSYSSLKSPRSSNKKLEKSPDSFSELPIYQTNYSVLPLANQEEKIVSKFAKANLQGKSLPTSSNHSVPHHDILMHAEKLFHKKDYTEAIKQAEQLITLHPRSFGAYYLLAEAYANLGDYNKATYYCQQAIELDSLSVLPYYLLAHIAEEKGELEKAKVFLKRIIYLAPSSISAYLDLAFIYKKEENTARAIKMLATAVELLKKLPSSARVERQGEVTAGQLLVELQKMFKQHI